MRKIVLVLVVLLSLFIFIVSASAQDIKVIFTIDQSNYTADNQVFEMDVKTFIRNERTYVPIRYLALALGVTEKDIMWQSPNVTLKLAGTELKLTEGSKTLYKNNQAAQMDVAVINRNGRTYLPARWVAEAFGYEVKWQPPRVLIGHDISEEKIQNAPLLKQEESDKNPQARKTELITEELSANAIAKKITDGVNDDIEKARMIHDWIAENINYDAESFLSGKLINRNTPDILRDHKGICGDYSLIFKEMCESVNIKSNIIKGYVLGGWGNPGQWAGHAWNEVFISGQWRQIDVTWDAGYLNEKGEWVKNLNYKYFNFDEEKFNGQRKR